jgi:hypothetical protein
MDVAPLIRPRLEVGEPHSLAAFWTANARDCRVLLLGRPDGAQPMRNFVQVVRDALAEFVATRQLQPAMLHVQIFFLGGFVKRILCLRAAFTCAFIAPRYLMGRGLNDWIVRVRHDRPTTTTRGFAWPYA